MLNIEPLYGHGVGQGGAGTGFRRALPFSTSGTTGSGTTGGGSQQAVGSTPLAGPSSLPITSQSSLSSSNGPGPVYFPEDEEIDFDRVLREEKIALPKGPSWTAHWLAVEGVQPLIPENPPAVPREGDGDPLAKGDIVGKVVGVTSGVNGVGINGINGINGTSVNGTGANGVNGLLHGTTSSSTAKSAAVQHAQNQQIVKQVLSRELQLYYARLTSSLLPPPPPSTTNGGPSAQSSSALATDFAKRTAALASLRHDAGLQALLPYLVRWVGEGVVGALKGEEGAGETEGRTLEVLLDVIGAILDNATLFVEPYVCSCSLSRYIFLYIFTELKQLSATPNPSPDPFHSPPLLPPPSTHHISPNNRLSDPLKTPHPALHNVPLAFPANNENTAVSTYLGEEECRHARGGDTRTRWCGQGGCKEGTGRWWRCEGRW